MRGSTEESAHRRVDQHDERCQSNKEQNSNYHFQIYELHVRGPAPRHYFHPNRDRLRSDGFVGQGPPERNRKSFDGIDADQALWRLNPVGQVA
jgi:hypothetical protein